MKGIRYRKGLGRRNLRSRPKTLPIWVMSNWDGKAPIRPRNSDPNQNWEVREVPYGQHMTMLALPMFKGPGMMRGLAKNQCTEQEAFVKGWFHLEPFEKSDVSNRPLWVETRWTYQTLIRMIAKIAHGAAVWQFGLDNFEPFLLPLILGSDVSSDHYYVGGIPEDIPRSWGPHNVEVSLLGDKAPYLILVGIRLFSDLGAPAYLAVVGKYRKEKVRGP
jgi:hypothetical protein